MAINRTSPKKGKIVDIPTVPTIGAATGGAGSASVAFTPATVGGPAFSYTALSNPGSITGTGTTSPITVSGLTGGTSYTFTVRGTNPSGNSEYTSASNSVVPTVATAFESIATVTVGSGGAADVSFTSIPSTYTHLQLRILVKSTAATVAYLRLRVNGDNTGSNYKRHLLYGTGSAAGALADQNGFYASLGDNTTSTFGVGITDILDYKDTNKYKTIRGLYGYEANNSGNEQIGLSSAVWLNTSAISSIELDFFDPSLDFAQYTHFALYGIKGA